MIDPSEIVLRVTALGSTIRVQNITDPRGEIYELLAGDVLVLRFSDGTEVEFGRKVGLSSVAPLPEVKKEEVPGINLQVQRRVKVKE